MIKKLKTLEEIKETFYIGKADGMLGYKVHDKKYRYFYINNFMVDLLGKYINVEKINNEYYDYKSDDGWLWNYEWFKEEDFLTEEDFSL